MTELLSTIPPDVSNLINSKQNGRDFVCASYLGTERLAPSIDPASSTSEVFLFKATCILVRLHGAPRVCRRHLRQ